MTDQHDVPLSHTDLDSEPSRAAGQCPDPHAANPRGRGRGLVYTGKVLLVALAILLAIRIVDGIEWSDLDARLSAVRWRWLAATVILLSARPVVWAVRWGLVVAAAGGAVRRLIVQAALAGAMAVNHITPGARVLGGFFRARWLVRNGCGGRLCSFGGCFGTVLFDQFVHQIVTGAATLGALIGGFALLGQPGSAAGLSGLALCTLVSVLAWNRRIGRGGLTAVIHFLTHRAARADGRMQRLYTHGREAVEVVQHLAVDPRLWRRSLALGVVFVGLNTLAQWVAFASLGSSPPLSLAFIGVALGATAGVLLGTPGGAGATEAAMIACYVALGMGRLDATAGVLLYRGLHYAVILALGLPCVAWLELRGNTAGGAPGVEPRAGAGSPDRQAGCAD